MIPAQRYARILQFLQSNGAASIAQIADHVGGSASTVRRDLEYLDGEGFIERSFGGASLRARALSTLEPDSAIATHIQHDEKAAIGHFAAAGIQANQSVIFDSSSTVLEAARAVARRTIPLTGVTNDLAIAQALAVSPLIRVVVIGGVIRPGSATLTGLPGELFIESVHADLALLGAHAITDGVLTETSLEVARVKQAMIKAARRVRVLVDHSKFREPSFCTICTLEDVDEIVTDGRADAAVLERIRKASVSVAVAPAVAG
jgi:DeoR family transcriptional regulator of aga operon